MPGKDVWSDSKNLSDDEKRFLDENVVLGSDIDPIPKIPDTPPAPKKKSSVPGTFKNNTQGLAKLRPDEVPIIGKHFVVWGSHYFSDIKPRPVLRSVAFSEDTHAEGELAKVKRLLTAGLKNPPVWTDPKTSTPARSAEEPGVVRWDRLERTNHYARWRYRGYLAKEITSL